MFWNKREDSSPKQKPGPQMGRQAREIRVDRDAPRPAAILRIAGEFEEQGDEIVELFKEVRSPYGNMVFPIHLRREGREVFVEVATEPWQSAARDRALKAAAVLRNSDYAEAGIEMISAYQVPQEVEFFLKRTPASLLQLDLLLSYNPDSPEICSKAFKGIAERHWGIVLDFTPESLPLVEELLLAALDAVSEPAILNALPLCLGSYLGDTIRHQTNSPTEWQRASEWGEEYVLELPEFTADPIGKARAFLSNGSEDSITYYADYVQREVQKGKG